MDWITPRVAIGDLDDAVNLPNLRKAGVTAILCLNGFPTFPRFEGFTWCQVPLRDGEGNQPSQVRAAVESIDRLVKADHRILVHCDAGASRAPFVGAVYLATYCGLGFRQALSLVAERRSATDINPPLLALYPLT